MDNEFFEKMWRMVRIGWLMGAFAYLLFIAGVVLGVIFLLMYFS